jgi:acetolactate synthase I/II/III large subunit
VNETASSDAGWLGAEVLARHGIDTIFTLSGGHLFPLYDGCVRHEQRLVDVRHEQTATFAAEGWAKVTRTPGVAALTAGPGVTNGVSAIAGANMAGSPIFVIGGRAPEQRWGSGSLQELDHIPIVASITKDATTIGAPHELADVFNRSLGTAMSPHRGPVFVDVPLDAWGPADIDVPDPIGCAGYGPDPEGLERIAELVRDARHPVLVVGADAYWASAEAELADFAAQARIPVFANGLGRGLLPADDELAFSRSRSEALREADLVVVAGTPLDFRLGFGRFGDASVVHIADAPSQVAAHVELAASIAGDLDRTFAGLAERAVPDRAHDDWIADLRAIENERRASEAGALEADASPIKPSRIYGELRKRLDRDAIVIGDGGDFVSYAGKLVDTFTPGCFLDPGPFGCLGTGMGYALAAGLAHPDRQVVALFGDGAIGFSLGDLDSLVRWRVNVVAIVGNNGIWGLEKHPMQAIFGYDVVADLRPGTRYDEVATALGAHGELVENPDEIGAALDRALATAGPSVINVLTDPSDAYPRSSNLG